MRTHASTTCPNSTPSAILLSGLLFSATAGCGLQPILDAGIDQTVSEGEAVTLTATNISTATLSNFIWEQLEGPAVEITGAAASQASFIAPAVEEETTLVFRVTAFSSLGTLQLPVLGDSFDLSTNLNLPTSDIITITVSPNPTPLADAGGDVTAVTGQTVTLQGGGLIDANVQLSYLWTQLSGTEVDLSGADNPSVSFTAPLVTGNTELVFQLLVEAEEGNIATDSVVVTIELQAPTATITGSSTAVEGQTVTFSGVGSSDPGGAMLSYLWEELDDNFEVTIADPSSEIISPTAPTVTEDTALTMRLTVTNEQGLSDSTTFTTTIQPYPAPIADAGPDQVANEGATVMLNGAGSLDPLGGDVTFQWTTITTSITLSSDTIERPAFAAPAVSTNQVYTFTLTITNEQGDQKTDTVSITVLNL